MAEIKEKKIWVLLRLLWIIPLSPLLALVIGFGVLSIGVKMDIKDLFR